MLLNLLTPTLYINIYMYIFLNFLILATLILHTSPLWLTYTGRLQSSLPPHCTYVKHKCHYYPPCSSLLLTFTWREVGGGSISSARKPLMINTVNAPISGELAQILQQSNESSSGLPKEEQRIVFFTAVRMHYSLCSTSD